MLVSTMYIIIIEKKSNANIECWTTHIEQILAVKLLANWSAARK